MSGGITPGAGSRPAGAESLAEAGVPASPPSPRATGLAIALSGVRLAYRGREILHGIDLEIGSGERLALIGPNGAGKSTLLRCVTGPAGDRVSGSVSLDGVRVDRLTRQQVARRVAVVPQQASVPFATPVEEVIALGRLPHEHPFLGPRPSDWEAVARAIERVGIGHLVGRDAREISLGERQLVLLAMAAAQEAPCLVLDEPTVHLDLRHQVATMELLRDLNERVGTTVVAVLHDLALASHFFPRLVVLDGGRIVADGPPEVALDPALVRDVFGVDPAILGRIASA